MNNPYAQPLNKNQSASDQNPLMGFMQSSSKQGQGTIGKPQISQNGTIQMNQNDPFDESFHTGKLDSRDQPMDLEQVNIDRDADMNRKAGGFSLKNNSKSKNIQI